MRKRILSFKEEGLMGVYIFTEHEGFPVAMASYSERDTVQISYLLNNMSEIKVNYNEICLWCKRHGILYQVICSSVTKRDALINIYYFLKYIIFGGTFQKL